MRISDWSSDVCSSDLAKRASRTTRSILLPPSHMAACAFRGGGGPAAPLSSGAKSSKRLKDHRGSRSYAARFQETRLRQVQAAEPLRLGRPAESAASLLLQSDGHDGGGERPALERKSDGEGKEGA